MSLFDGTADHYRRHRSPVPPEAAGLLLDGLDTHEPVLDLGTGTGLVLQALAPLTTGRLIGVDPDQHLLDQAADALEADADRLRLLRGSAEDDDLPERVGANPGLVTICRAFHWMDQPLVASRVHGLLLPGGRLAVMGDGSLWTSTLPWKIAVRETVQEFLGQQRRAGDGTYRHSGLDWPTLLTDTGFAEVREAEVPYERNRLMSDLPAFVHSFSFARPGLFGDRLEAFDERLLERGSAYAVDDVLVDGNVFSVLLATR